MSDMKNSDPRNRTTSAGNQETMPESVGIESDRPHLRSLTRPNVRRIKTFRNTQSNPGSGADGGSPGLTDSQ
jgi:hypothetical protein